MSLTLLPVALLSFLAGAANSIAGGGTLLTFPALVGLGIPPIVANATSTVALVPGSFTSMMGYRDALRDSRAWLAAFAIPSAVGGAIGALLLVITPEQRFSQVVPFLVLGATALFVAQKPIVRAIMRSRASHHLSDRAPAPNAAFIAVQFLVGVYGGYFGAAAGIVMLATLGLMGLTNIHQMNGLKNWAAICFNGVAATTFMFSGFVNWPVALVMAVGAASGGWTGAHIAQRVRPEVVRGAIGAIGVGAAIWLFTRL
ncbi:MAG TPA: sulfite exporter TauE/SafE family protein [Gemmatimonadaceae bacterium]|nr:sulfite exporter TauE/SafE family protein [Gemmatimonadaceae bacterium]